MHDLLFWLLLVVTPVAGVLVALAIRHLRSPREVDKSRVRAEAPARVDGDELLQSIHSLIQRLNGISSPQAGRAVAAAGPLRPCAQDGEDGGRLASIAEAIEIASGHSERPLAGTLTRDRHLADLAEQLHQLSELTESLYEEWRALERNANVSESREVTAASRHYLGFTLGDEHFALSMQNLTGVVEAVQLIANPGMPSTIRRAIKLQGALVPVIDLGARLGGQPIEIGWNTRILLLEVTRGGSRQTVGMLVDTVGKVLEIAPADIEPRPSFATHIQGDFILGIVGSVDRPVILLDIARVLSPGRPALQAATGQATPPEHLPT